MKKLLIIGMVAAVSGCASLCDDCNDCTLGAGAGRGDGSPVTYGEYKELAARVDAIEQANKNRIKRIGELREARKEASLAAPKKPYKVDPKAVNRVEKAAKKAK